MKTDNIYIALDNIRSLHNVGAIMRTCSFFGIKNLILIGYSGTTYDFKGNRIIHPKISKTALGAEKSINNVLIFETISKFLTFVLEENLNIISIEQDENATPLQDFEIEDRCVLVFGNEREGVSKYIMNKSKKIVEIVGKGDKDSLNVSSVVAVVVNHLQQKMDRINPVHLR